MPYCNHDAEFGSGSEKQLKRCREEENVWEDFANIQSSIFEELSSIMQSIDSAEV